MPIDDTIPCALNSSLITHKNCREFDVSFFVLIYYLSLRKKNEYLTVLVMFIHPTWICQSSYFLIQHRIDCIVSPFPLYFETRVTENENPREISTTKSFPNLSFSYHGGTCLTRWYLVDICPTHVKNWISYTLKTLILFNIFDSSHFLTFINMTSGQ